MGSLLLALCFHKKRYVCNQLVGIQGCNEVKSKSEDTSENGDSERMRP